ncbi:isoprenoid biosynthesis glyoxalase ElbB [Vibrio parahaemolyticus]|nr:isoprenoid biosynthesis glyoxalase ElbB [Vibrio parahaemolyticus]
MKNIAVILSGCGVFDGSEINETVLTLLSLEKNKVSYQCYAPDMEQHHVINHISGVEQQSSRNILVESARITRGNIKPLQELDEKKHDALIVPGGFGVAKNLCDFALKGENYSILNEFQNVMEAFALAKKPVGYMCIAPILLPKVYKNIKCTIGNDKTTAEVIEKLSGKHIDCTVDDIVTDTEHKVVTTPAYMLAENIYQAHLGIEKLVEKVLSMI